MRRGLLFVRACSGPAGCACGVQWQGIGRRHGICCLPASVCFGGPMQPAWDGACASQGPPTLRAARRCAPWLALHGLPAAGCAACGGARVACRRTACGGRGRKRPRGAGVLCCRQTRTTGDAAAFYHGGNRGYAFYHGTCPHVQARAQTKVHGLYVPTKTAARFPSPRPICVAGPTGLRRHRSKIKKSAEGVSTSPWNGAQCRSSGPADQSSGRDVRGSLLCEYPLLATKVAPLPGEHAPYSSVPRGEGQVLRLKHVVYGCEERDDVMILVVVVRPANHNMVV